MERAVCDFMSHMLFHKLDPLQFAYRAKGGVEDISLTLLYTVVKLVLNGGLARGGDLSSILFLPTPMTSPTGGRL